MEKNYYDILEINKNASPEILEKSYKTLIKKYHPDLQKDNLKIQYEEKIKKINEAYEILSNPEKRKNYNLQLENSEISKKDYENLIKENIYLKNEINSLKNNINNYHPNNKTNYNNIHSKIKQEINNAVNQAYYDAYIQDLKNRGYKIKYKKTLKDFIALLITISIIIFIFIILWNIPFTKNYLISNPIFKFIIDLFLNLFNNN